MGKFTRGFTLIEILIVLALIAVLVSIAFSSFYRIKDLQVLNSTISDIVSTIHKAKVQSLASLNSSIYGVHFEIDKVIIFKTQTYDPQSPDNEILEVTKPAEISIINLLDGGSDIYFARLTGFPSTTGEISISASSMTKSFTIDVFGQINQN